MKDYFEHIEQTPAEVQEIVSEMQEYVEAGTFDPYTVMMMQLHKLQKIGWTFEYGLDAEPYELTPMSQPAIPIHVYEDIRDIVRAYSLGELVTVYPPIKETGLEEYNCYKFDTTNKIDCNFYKSGK